MVREPAYFMVTEKRSGMTFPFVNDRPGHYRSPDIGESVEELAGTAVDPKNLEFELSLPATRTVKLTERAAQEQGRGGGELQGGARGHAAAAAAQTGRDRRASSVDHSRPGADAEAPAGGVTQPSRCGCSSWAWRASTIIAGAAARTSGRRRSTAR